MIFPKKRPLLTERCEHCRGLGWQARAERRCDEWAVECKHCGGAGYRDLTMQAVVLVGRRTVRAILAGTWAPKTERGLKVLDRLVRA